MPDESCVRTFVMRVSHAVKTKQKNLRSFLTQNFLFHFRRIDKVKERNTRVHTHVATVCIFMHRHAWNRMCVSESTWWLIVLIYGSFAKTYVSFVVTNKMNAEESTLCNELKIEVSPLYNDREPNATKLVFLFLFLGRNSYSKRARVHIFCPLCIRFSESGRTKTNSFEMLKFTSNSNEHFLCRRRSFIHFSPFVSFSAFVCCVNRLSKFGCLRHARQDTLEEGTIE